MKVQWGQAATGFAAEGSSVVQVEEPILKCYFDRILGWRRRDPSVPPILRYNGWFAVAPFLPTPNRLLGKEPCAGF